MIRAVLRAAHFLTNLLVVRLAFAGLGAWAGLWLFVGLVQLLPVLPWLESHELALWNGATLPLTAFVWLACAAAGAAAFTRGWSLALNRTARR